MSHSKCHFSHSGGCTRIPCSHILKNQRKLHKKSVDNFWPTREMCRSQDASAISKLRKNANYYLVYIEILKTYQN